MHHAGLLPIVKEVVEMLFCRGVIKVTLNSYFLYEVHGFFRPYIKTDLSIEMHNK